MAPRVCTPGMPSSSPDIGSTGSQWSVLAHRDVMYSESGAESARGTKALSKSSFSGFAPSLVKMLSLFVLKVIKSLTEPFP